ncbi:cytochrome c oxidase subunit II [Pseudalkalibacillus hwajinpoensis]|uniref:cytochrome c oxidase subunit II n=1 Tax=Guptibacillus hwajinpoensis TaxID=208199 RepID=UPI00325C2BFC
MLKTMNRLTICFVLVLLSGCSNIALLDPKGTAAEEQLSLLWFSLLLMSIVLIVVFTLFTRFLIKYRERPGQEYDFPVQIEGDKKVEITWIVLPIVILVVLAVPTLATTYQLDETPTNDQNPLIVEVTAEQFQWTFHYPEYNITLLDELKLPVNRPVIFKLHSKDVIHSFWIPRLGGKKDALPHQENTLVLTAIEPGTYDGKCAELCGANHALMSFNTDVVEKDEFLNWVKSSAEREED